MGHAPFSYHFFLLDYSKNRAISITFFLGVLVSISIHLFIAKLSPLVERFYKIGRFLKRYWWYSYTYFNVYTSIHRQFSHLICQKAVVHCDVAGFFCLLLDQRCFRIFTLHLHILTINLLAPSGVHHPMNALRNTYIFYVTSFWLVEQDNGMETYMSTTTIMSSQLQHCHMQSKHFIILLLKLLYIKNL